MSAAGLVLLSLALMGAFEGTLRVAGIGEDERAALDFGRPPDERLYGPDPGEPGMVTLAPWILRMRERDIRKLVNRDRFPARRPPGELRIFTIGESTVFGYPWGGSVAFPGRLEEILRARLTDRHVRVVNAGVPTYDSGRVARVMDEVLAYEPQVVIVYSGHNEYLKRFALERLASLPLRFRLRQGLARLRTYQLLSGLLRPLARRTARDLDVSRVVEELSEPEGLARPRTAGETALVLERYRKNLLGALTAARRVGAHVVLCTVASRLQADPLHSVPDDPAHEAQLAPFVEALQAPTLEPGAREAIARSALRIAPGFAPLQHALGVSLEAQGRLPEARAAFAAARQLESNPRRGGDDINGALRELARRTDATLIDVEAALAATDDRGCFGEQLFWDHCHPDAEGHARIAELIADGVDWAALPVSGHRM